VEGPFFICNLVARGVLCLRKRLVIFKYSFVEEDGHDVLNGNGIDISEGISDGWHR
jgi:hypothetical protein